MITTTTVLTSLIANSDVAVVRGQTMSITLTLRDEAFARVDLTGAQAYLWVRADMKSDASIKLASVVTSGHRVGIVIADQTAEHRGEFTATLIPSDTSTLVALGADDPYLYDAWVVLADASRWPVIALSKMPLYPEGTTIA